MLKNGGSVQSEIQALNFILDRTLYEHDEDNGTIIVPGHGRVCNEFEVAEYRDMIVIISDTIQHMIDQKMTLEQIKAASPAKAWEPEFGAMSGPWTTNDFVEAVYKSLTSKKR